MKLTQLKREVERLKDLARNRRIFCACQYIEIQASQSLTGEQERILQNNRTCYERNQNGTAHVGWTSIIVPPRPRITLRKVDCGVGITLITPFQSSEH
jgi:hypothetical protein